MLLTAKIKRIDVSKRSRNGDVKFARIYFELEDGSFAMTDLVSSFRNFRFWKPIIEAGAGTKIGGVFLIGKDKVNADSEVYIIQEPLIKEHQTNLNL